VIAVIYIKHHIECVRVCKSVCLFVCACKCVCEYSRVFVSHCMYVFLYLAN
jgi:hypothetical protein